MYLVNSKRIIYDNGTIKAMDDNDVLTMAEHRSLTDFIKDNENGAIKVRSTVR